MKKIVSMAILSLSLAVPVLYAAQETKSDPKAAKEPKVYCCHGKGDCDKIHTKAECEKEGGKVVTHCKECK
jgi:hypothetical protein